MDALAASRGRWRARGAPSLKHGAAPSQTPIERFLEPCLLLTLAQGPAHGYILKEHCETRCLVEEPIDPGTLYRTMRRMEEQGWVASDWSAEGPGPRRRVYRLTPLGEEVLHSWALGLRRQKATIESFLRLYEQHFKPEDSADAESAGEGPSHCVGALARVGWVEWEAESCS
ncbi:MAG TPA: PadR family transcriptional regulator [Dehalococcoidia bacterium]|nr:PadR family transcriptional regulator [Dehalococcoidia bacterium]